LAAWREVARAADRAGSHIVGDARDPVVEGVAEIEAAAALGAEAQLDQSLAELDHGAAAPVQLVEEQGKGHPVAERREAHELEVMTGLAAQSENARHQAVGPQTAPQQRMQPPFAPSRERIPIRARASCIEPAGARNEFDGTDEILPVRVPSLDLRQ